MIFSPKYVLLITLMFFLVSCASFNGPDKIKEKLIGTWILDSVSIPSGKYYKPDAPGVFNFIDRANYSYEWTSGDIEGKETGKYTVTINPQRALATVSFIPNITILRKDTVRTRYLNFDIVELGATRLQTIDQTTFIERKGMPSLIFNKRCIYKRAKIK